MVQSIKYSLLLPHEVSPSPEWRLGWPSPHSSCRERRRRWRPWTSPWHPWRISEMKFVKNFQVLDCPSIAHNEGWIFLCFFRHGDVVDIWYMFLMMCWSAWSYVECSKIFPMCFFVFVCMQGKICIVKSYRSHVSGAGDLKKSPYQHSEWRVAWKGLLRAGNKVDKWHENTTWRWNPPKYGEPSPHGCRLNPDVVTQIHMFAGKIAICAGKITIPSAPVLLVESAILLLKSICLQRNHPTENGDSKGRQLMVLWSYFS